MKIFLSLLVVASLTGCATAPNIPVEPKVIIKFERVVATIPSDLLNIPEPIPNLPIEVLKSDDRAVAKWLLDSEDRMLSLEAQIRRIRELYIKQLREAKAANVKEGASAPSSTASSPQ